MRYNKTFLVVVLAVLVLTSSAMGSQKWMRGEAPYTVKEIVLNKVALPNPQGEYGKHQWLVASLPTNQFLEVAPLVDPEELPTVQPVRGETLDEILGRIRPKSMNDKDFGYMREEVKFLNRGKINPDGTCQTGAKLKLPVYKPLNSYACSDMRNIMVAVMKGKKYGVHWAYLIGVRTQENPSPRRDHFAYGVMCKKGTNLWTQAEWGAKILRRCTGKAAANPSFAAMDRASHTYVGYETPTWPKNVYAVYKRCQL